MAILTVTNQKGGVGKTTTTLNLAVALAERGARVLAIDFDPQGSLTTCCGLSEPDRLPRGRTIAEALLTSVNYPVPRPVTLREIVVSTPAGVSLVPASQDLATAEQVLYAVYGREFALRDVLTPVRADYDAILIDSVPTLGLLAINSLAAADGLIIPVQAEFLAVHGLEQLLESVNQVRQRLNPRLEIWGVALTMVDHRNKHSREVAAGVRVGLDGQVRVFKTEIPEDVKLKESSQAGVSVLRYQTRARASQAYRDLAEEVSVLLAAAPAAPPPNGTVPPLAGPPAAAASDGAAPSPSPNGADPASGPPAPAPPVGAGWGGPPIPITTTRLGGVCPYLGLLTDATVHSPEVRPEHRCYATSPPLEISLRDQHLTCLTPQHAACVRFFRANLNGIVSPSYQPPESSTVIGRLRNLLKRPP